MINVHNSRNNLESRCERPQKHDKTSVFAIERLFSAILLILLSSLNLKIIRVFDRFVGERNFVEFTPRNYSRIHARKKKRETRYIFHIALSGMTNEISCRVWTTFDSVCES